MTNERLLEKFRKLTALHNAASTEGERQACLAALSRLKEAVGPESFAEASRKARQSEKDEAFLRKAKDRAARKEAGFQRYQQQQRKRDFVKDIVESFTRPKAAPVDPFTNHQATNAMRSAYPNAYGDRRG